MPHIFVRTRLTSILLAIFAASQLTACSTEENLGSAASQTLMTWVAPSEREDGSPISLADIAGYRIYYGDAQGVYRQQFEIDNAYDIDVGSAELKLASGVYYAVVTTVDTDGRESAFSQEVTLRL